MGKIYEAMHKSASRPNIDDKETSEITVGTTVDSTVDATVGTTVKKRPAPAVRHTEAAFSSPRKGNYSSTHAAWDPRLLLSTDKSSPIAESFRKLRTKILHPTDGPPPRSILITSAVPMEGKGFVAANLGVAIAHGLEQRCLLVDCDLRRPKLAELFSLDNTSGLSNFLSGQANDLARLIQGTSMEKLSVLASGLQPEKPSELIDSSRMKEVFHTFHAQAEEQLVIFDSPPMQAAAETAVLAKMVDKVLIVVRWGYSGREQVKNLIEAIGREKIIGIVFNAFEKNVMDSLLERKGFYGYSGYYGEGYYGEGY